MAVMEILAMTKVPLHKDVDGVFRVGGTRVRLDTVLTAFDQGGTPEQIAFKYPSLHLSDIYAVIAYYLQHRDEVEEYRAVRRLEIQVADQEVEARFPSNGVRERLLARRPLCG
jgi:uncharacterized protein (DUF433 family)